MHFVSHANNADAHASSSEEGGRSGVFKLWLTLTVKISLNAKVYENNFIHYHTVYHTVYFNIASNINLKICMIKNKLQTFNIVSALTVDQIVISKFPVVSIDDVEIKVNH